ncbi:hypothetical protein [Rhizobium ruizarguesonis]|uniref:hypothetical protein n=1 Tax=Rhizobium ruizarguesonis TaxID=2081791 RepID=UPI00102F36DD|nr:hypothetical protein [Rhizobium ruizarguesonis]TAY95832.1 hypothetical protein ELH85_22780 [Rhizobium ruizarguesonis]
MAERFFGWQTIYGVDGEHSTPYLTRAWIGRLRLHIFYRGDNDPDPHDHPWDFWTFPLTTYVEEVARPVTKGVAPLEMLLLGPEKYALSRQVVEAFRLHYRPATYCHRVLGRTKFTSYGAYGGNASLPESDTVPGKIITIVWRGKGGRKWGFLRNRDGNWCWTPWREYVFGGGKQAPCEPPSPSQGEGAA